MITNQSTPRPTTLSATVQRPLPRPRRRFLFLALCALFVCTVPIFAFYATGYRYDFFSTGGAITATGGLYISVGAEAGELFLNNEPVTDSRIFREALYIQNIAPGLQRVHVQALGYHTWVKELPVYAHIVTEGAAFLLPFRPQVRPITAYTTSTGTPVYLGIASTTLIVPFASTSISYVATSSKATTTLNQNSEYLFINSLFGTTTATTTLTPIINRVIDEARVIFQSPATSTATSTTLELATTTITQSNTVLFERNGDIFVRYTGSERTVPYYFCIPNTVIASSTPRYEAQLMAARLAYAQEQGLSEIATSTDGQLCRREIMIDRQWQEVKSFQFFPGTTDLILLHRTDGVVVTEVDDRAWQNTQRLYPASATALKVEGGRLYIKDSGYIFELLTELPAL